MSNKIKMIDLQYFSCFLISVWTIFPFLYRNTNHLMIILLFGLWFVSCYLTTPKVIVKRSIIFVSVYLIYIIGYRLLNISEAIYIKYIQQFFFWLPIVFWFNLEKQGDDIRNRRFINALIWMYAISFLLNIFLIATEPDALIMYNRVGGERYLSTNIGETPFSYVGALVFLFSLFVVNNTKSNREKRKYTILVIISALLVISMQRSITILVVGVGFFYQLYKRYTNKKSISYKIVWTVLMVSLILVVVSQYNNFINLVAPFIPSDRVVDRLRELGMIAFKGDSRLVRDYSATTRISLYTVSIDTWSKNFHNFLFGVGYPNMSYNESYNLVGGHSELFDTLARYGLIGMLLLFFAFYNIFREIYRDNDSKYRYFILVIGLTTLGYGALSGFLETPSIGTTMFLFIPMGLKLLSVNGGLHDI